MQLFFRIFVIGLVLLCSCNSGLFREQKSKAKPYFFSVKKNSKSSATVASDNQPKTPPALLTPGQPTKANTLPYILPTKENSQPLTVHQSITHANDNPAVEQQVEEGGAAVKLRRHKKEQQQETAAYKPGTVLPKAKADGWLLGNAALAALAAACLAALALPKAKGIAGWAKENKKKSWLLLGIGHLLTSSGGSLIGQVLYRLGYQTSDLTTYTLFGTAALAVLLYAAGNRNSRSAHIFLKSRLALLMLLLSGFFLFIDFGNRNAADESYSPVSTKIEQALNLDTLLTAPLTEAITAATSPEATLAIDLLAVLLFFVIVAMLLILLLLLAYISCALLCAGIPILGLAVLVAGVFGLIVLTILVFKDLFRGAKHRKAKRQEKRAAEAKPATGE